MKRTAIGLGVAAAAIWSAGVFAQGRNFAGSWTVDSEKTMAAMTARLGTVGSGGGGGAIVAAAGGGGGRSGGGASAGGFGGGGTAVGGAVLRSADGGGGVAAVGGGGGGGRGRGAAGPTTIAMDASTFTVGTMSYHLDGSVTTTETPRGNVTAKAAWKGDKLVIETTNPGANGSVTQTATWYLEGESLVRETSTPTPDGGEPRVNKTYFKKG